MSEKRKRGSSPSGPGAQRQRTDTEGGPPLGYTTLTERTRLDKAKVLACRPDLCPDDEYRRVLRQAIARSEADPPDDPGCVTYPVEYRASKQLQAADCPYTGQAHAQTPSLQTQGDDIRRHLNGATDGDPGDLSVLAVKACRLVVIKHAANQHNTIDATVLERFVDSGDDVGALFEDWDFWGQARSGKPRSAKALVAAVIFGSGPWREAVKTYEEGDGTDYLDALAEERNLYWQLFPEDDFPEAWELYSPETSPAKRHSYLAACCGQREQQIVSAWEPVLAAEGIEVRVRKQHDGLMVDRVGGGTAGLRAKLEVATLAATDISVKVGDKTAELKLTEDDAARFTQKVPPELKKRVKAEEKLLEQETMWQRRVQGSQLTFEESVFGHLTTAEQERVGQALRHQDARDVLPEAAYAKHHQYDGKTWYHLDPKTGVWSRDDDPAGTHLMAAIGVSAGIFDDDAASVGLADSVLAWAEKHPEPAVPIKAFDVMPWQWVRALRGHRAFLDATFLDKLDDLDRVKNIFPFRNGYIDLLAPEEGLKPYQPTMYVSQTTGYDFPDRPTPEHFEFVEAFFKSIWPDTLGYGEQREYVQSELARMLFAGNLEHLILALLGVGRNGKGVLVGMIEAVFGQLWGTIEWNALEKGRKAGANPDLHRLLKKRVVVVQEAGNDANPPDEQLLNRLSGGDSIAVRTLHKTHEREQPVAFTLLMLMNEMFSSAGNAASKALFYRVKGIEFPVQFKTEDDPEYVPDDPRYAIKDPSLKDKLRTGPDPDPEAKDSRYRDALLYMLLDLVPTLQRGNGVKIPARVRNYTGKIAADSDPGQAALQVVAKKQPGNFKFHVQDYRNGGKHVAQPDPDGRPLLVTSSQAHSVLKKYMEIQHDSKWSKAKTDKLLKQAYAAQGFALMNIAKGKKAGARQWAVPGYSFALDDPDLRRNSEDEDQWQFRAMAWNSDEAAYQEVTEVMEEAEPEPEIEIEIESGPAPALETTIKVSLHNLTRKTSKTIDLGYVDGETRGAAVDRALVQLGLETSCPNTNPDRVKPMERGGVAQGHFRTI